MPTYECLLFNRKGLSLGLSAIWTVSIVRHYCPALRHASEARRKKLSLVGVFLAPILSRRANDYSRLQRL